MKRTIFLAAVLGLMLMVGPASAVVVIDFSSGFGTGGTVDYAGGVNPLVGSNIAIGLVGGMGTPSNDGDTELVTGACTVSKNPFGIKNAGCLNFTTGNFVSASGGVDTFGPGGSITITGSGPGCTTVGGCGGGSPNATSGPALLTGQVVSATFDTNGKVQLTITSGSDTKDTSLTAFFGLPANALFQFGPGTIHSALTSGPDPTTGAFTSDSTNSTDIPNAVVPEPTSILLLGTVLVGAVRLARRRVAKA